MPMGSGLALCEGVSTPHGSGKPPDEKSRFQPGIHIHIGTLNAYLENFSLFLTVNNFARWDNETWSLEAELSHAIQNATPELYACLKETACSFISS